MYLSKYGVARHIYIAIPKAGSANHAASGDWTPAAGDVKISKDGGAAANVTNLPTAIAMGNSTEWDFSLTATEMQAAQIVVTIADSATKAVDDTGFSIETYGNASAQHAFDLATATQSVNVSQISGDSTAADNLENAYDDTAGPVPWHGIDDQGTAQSATATTLVLRAASAFADDTLIGCTIGAFGSTQGYWQFQVITDNVLSTDTVTVPGWTVTPSGTITYKIFGTAAGTGVAQTGDAYAIVASGTHGNAALKTLIDTVDNFIDTEVAAIKAKTDNLPTDPADQSLIEAAITAAQTALEARTLTAALIAKLTAHLNAVLTVIVGSGSTTTGVVFNTSTGINGTVPSATNDFYNGRVIVFLTGTLAGQATSITDYAGSTVTATVPTMTAAPQAGDTAIMV